MIDFVKRWTSSEHERTCQELSAYLDDELSTAHRSRLERHLQQCKDCREELASLRQTVELVQALPSVKLPRSFLLHAGEAAAQQRVQRARLGYSFLQAATAAATALLILVVSGDALLRYRPIQSVGARRAPQALAAPTAFAAEPTAGVRSIAPASPLEGVAAEVETSAPAQVQSVQAAPEQSPEVAKALPLEAGSPSPQPAAPMPTDSASQGASPEALVPTSVAQTAKSNTGGVDHVDAGSATAQAAGTIPPPGAPPTATPLPQPAEGMLPTIEPPTVSLPQSPTAAAPPAQTVAASAGAQEATATPVRLAALASPPANGTPAPERGQPASATPTWLTSLLTLRPYMRGLERVLAILVAALAAAMVWLRKHKG